MTSDILRLFLRYIFCFIVSYGGNFFNRFLSFIAGLFCREKRDFKMLFELFLCGGFVFGFCGAIIVGGKRFAILWFSLDF